MLSAVSRAPLAKLQAYKRRMGWTFPWASSAGSDFNADFNIAFTEEQQREGGIEYNYKREGAFGGGGGPETPAALCGTDPGTFLPDRPGPHAFPRQDGAGHHTYS